MTAERAARRHPASEFPEIRGVSLWPSGAAATLVNLSATGALVGCAARSLPGTMLTVRFDGTFEPAAIECRVVRCEVAGIAPDGSLLFQLGLAFSTRLALAQDANAAADEPEDTSADSPVAAVAAPAAHRAVPVLRNRW